MGFPRAVYRPREAEHTVLHQVVAEHLEAFLGAVAEAGDGASLPQFVERDRYLGAYMEAQLKPAEERRRAEAARIPERVMLETAAPMDYEGLAATETNPSPRDNTPPTACCGES